MTSSNRRGETRIDVRIPIRFRPITNPPSAEQSAESVNISEHGAAPIALPALRGASAGPPGA
jgi:hypothetical protein